MDSNANVQANGSRERALVLGGGGVTGVAWELGVLVGLHDGGLGVRDANRIVGTSAGSVVGAQITSGVDIESLFAAQTLPPEQSGERVAAIDMEGMGAALAGMFAGGGPVDGDAVRARIGAYALNAQTISEEERMAVISKRLPLREWPQQGELLITAVDVETGRLRVFDRGSGVSLVDAVTASCAVPGVWPPVSIEGHRYMDGGMRSSINADLANGFRNVLLLAPLGMINWGPLGDTADEVAQLERAGSVVRVVTPDTASVAAIGTNVLDPAQRAGAALAGREQGRALVESLRAFWQTR
jgi:NTE family protein